MCYDINSIGLAETLITHGAKLDKINIRGNTPLMECINCFKTVLPIYSEPDLSQANLKPIMVTMGLFLKSEPDLDTLNKLSATALYELDISLTKEYAFNVRINAETLINTYNTYKNNNKQPEAYYVKLEEKSDTQLMKPINQTAKKSCIIS